MKKILIIFITFSIKISAQCFTLGADLSYTNAVLSSGGTYRDAANNVINPYELLASKGANMVRMRLFHTPQNIINNCGNSISANSINDVILGFTTAKSNGMKLKLSLHYGDYFNDPSKQKRPQAWVGLSNAVLLDSIYNYTFSSLEKFKIQNVLPDIVAIGNETTWGFIDEVNTTNGWSWPEDAAKFNIAFSAVDDFNAANNTSIKKAVHFTENTAIWLTDLFSANNIVNYDIIGLSFYPEWSNLFNLSQLANMISTLKTSYNKDVMIFETGVPWTTSSADGYSNIINNYGNLTYPISPEGQKQFFADLAMTVYNAGGIGVLYWEPNWISSSFCDFWGQGSSYENLSFFNFNNNNKALPIFDVFNFCTNLNIKSQNLTSVGIYPNPATTEVRLEGIENNTKVIISDMFGRVVAKKFVREYKINFPELENGIYFLTFYSEDRLITAKIIVE